MTSRWRRIAVGTGAVLAAGVAIAVGGAYSLAAPYRSVVGALPSDLTGRNVTFTGAEGARLRGWFVPSDHPAGVVVLMHGVRANRLQMLDRARFLHRAGYAVLLYDSRAQGESTGDRITFGYLESQDARVAVQLARTLGGDRRVAIIGVSLGGAAAILANPPLDVNALVLESVYPEIHQAVENRLRAWTGPVDVIATPVLMALFQPILRFPASELRPIDRVAGLTVPKFFIFGTADKYTTMDESLQLVARVGEPKQSWAIQGAGHVDLFRYAGEEYRRRVLEFLREADLKGRLRARLPTPRNSITVASGRYSASPR